MACQVFTLLNEMVLDKLSMLFSVMDAIKGMSFNSRPNFLYFVLMDCLFVF